MIWTNHRERGARRCMQERMKELLGEALADRGSGTAQKCEQALALATLAAFLSYLTFGLRPPTSSLSSCQNSHLSDLPLHLIS